MRYSHLSPGVFVAVRVRDRNDDPVDSICQSLIDDVHNQLVDDVQSDGRSHPLSSMDSSVNDDHGFPQVLEASCRDSDVFDLATFVAEAGVDDRYDVRVFLS